MRTIQQALLLAAGAALIASGAGATVEMQSQAKKLGFPVKNCLYCHASPHAAEAMKKKASALKIAEGNCLACHGSNIPAALNHRGAWLVAEKGPRGAKQCDMAWLKAYKEPAPTPKARPEPAQPELIKVAPPLPPE